MPSRPLRRGLFSVVVVVAVFVREWLTPSVRGLINFVACLRVVGYAPSSRRTKTLGSSLRARETHHGSRLRETVTLVASARPSKYDADY